MQIINGDCKEEMQKLINDGMRVDSIVTDPPYELGFMGKAWDKTGIAYDVEMWRLCFELLKPGGHLLSFGGSRTYHRMACAIEDAGFEIRDQIMWITGQGFPKSLNLGNGLGTGLKPAHEPIVLARKPISEKTIAQNVLMHGTGGLNIDGCRIVGSACKRISGINKDIYGADDRTRLYETHTQGRFPANIIHDGSDEVLDEFAKYGERDSGGPSRKPSGFYIKDYDESGKNVYGSGISVKGKIVAHQDKGTASRFFYCAKASKKDRNGSKHPTVKPIALMKYLCRLITPKGGIVLDPFAGTGTTGIAAHEEGFDPILIERDAEYIKDIQARFHVKREHYTEKDLFNDVCEQSSW